MTLYTLETYIEEKSINYIHYVLWHPEYLHEYKAKMPLIYPESSMIFGISDTIKSLVDTEIIKACQKYLSSLVSERHGLNSSIRNILQVSLSRNWRTPECGVCFTKVEDGDIVLYPCSHMVCWDCHWQIRRLKSIMENEITCPFCRKNNSRLLLEWKIEAFLPSLSHSLLRTVISELYTYDITLWNDVWI